MTRSLLLVTAEMFILCSNAAEPMTKPSDQGVPIQLQTCNALPKSTSDPLLIKSITSANKKAMSLRPSGIPSHLPQRVALEDYRCEVRIVQKNEIQITYFNKAAERWLENQKKIGKTYRGSLGTFQIRVTDGTQTEMILFQ